MSWRKVFLLLIISTLLRGANLFAQTEQFHLTAPIPLDPGDEWVYRSSLDIKGHHLSALYVIKCFSKDHFRIAMVSELGIKLLDIAYRKGEFIEHYVMEELQRPILLKGIRDDMLILLKVDMGAKVRSSQGGYKIRSGRLKYHYDADGKLEKIVKRKLFLVEKKFIFIHHVEHPVPEKIVEEVPLVKMKHTMKLLKQ